MIKQASVIALILCLSALLSACLSLPGSDAAPPARYSLATPDLDCSENRGPLELTISRVASGLDTERIAYRNNASGEISYLQGLRWVDRVGNLLEQRLAADLECKGHTVITSHHSKLSHPRLVCEVRALNLVETRGGDDAEVALSCVLFAPAGSEDRHFQAVGTSELNSWNAGRAVAAISSAYAEAITALTEQMAE